MAHPADAGHDTRRAQAKGGEMFLDWIAGLGFLQKSDGIRSRLSRDPS